jgi:hypothetical protein
MPYPGKAPVQRRVTIIIGPTNRITRRGQVDIGGGDRGTMVLNLPRQILLQVLHTATELRSRKRQEPLNGSILAVATGAGLEE